MFQNQQARICLLYLPLFELLYQNLKQLSAQPPTFSSVLGLNVSLLRTLGVRKKQYCVIAFLIQHYCLLTLKLPIIISGNQVRATESRNSASSLSLFLLCGSTPPFYTIPESLRTVHGCIRFYGLLCHVCSYSQF